MNPTRKKLIPTGQPHERQHPLDAGGVKITTFIPLQFKKRGCKKVVVGPVGVDDPVVLNAPEPAISPSQDPTLLKALSRGCYWQHLLDTGAAEDTAEIAEREGLYRGRSVMPCDLRCWRPASFKKRLMARCHGRCHWKQCSGAHSPLTGKHNGE